MDKVVAQLAASPGNSFDTTNIKRNLVLCKLKYQLKGGNSYKKIMGDG
jgi:hypothetical protein